MNLDPHYPAFSVLMSVYNGDSSLNLDTALESILNQSLSPSEIIIVEDGPVNRSISKVIDKYISLFRIPVKIVHLSKNTGLANALAIGTNYVSNDWIARMDADDWSVPDRFENQIKYICQHPDVAVLGGQIKEFSGNITNVVGNRRVPFESKMIKKFIKWRSPFNHPTVLINKNKLKEVGGYQSFGNLEDYYLWARFASSNYILVNLPQTVVYMRVNDDMYARRGKRSNIIYIFKLRRYLFQKNLVSLPERYVGDLFLMFNILLPNKVRKFIYREVLHRK